MNWLVERRLADVAAKLRAARAELAVLDEQHAFMADEADDLRIRSMVAETPQASIDFSESQRAADAMARARGDLRRRIDELVSRQDDLLDRMSARR